MDTVEGKVAVVTGGASGIGLALARRFAAEGASVVLADVEEAALEAAAAGIAEAHGADRVLAVRTDVRHDEQVRALAAATFERFGTAHVVCNNAGVGVGGLAWDIPADRWRWILDVNLTGVANGIRAFVPRLIEQGEGHVVNTASSAGLVTGPAMSPYYATKHAVVALTESLHFDLQLVGAPVGTSVLCPEWVRTGIADSERNRPDDVEPMPVGFGMPEPPLDEAGSPSGDGDGAGDGAGDSDGDGDEGPDGDGDGPDVRSIVHELVEGGMDPADVADQVLDAIRTGRFWVVTHPTTLATAQRRWDAIAAGGQPTLWDVTAGG